MRLDMDRICQLAGIKGSSQQQNSSKMLRESAHETEEGYGLDEMDHAKEELNEEEEEEKPEDEDEEANEMVEIDEVMLVQELRRAKRLMNESRKRQEAKRQKLQEMQLKAVIDQEVKNVIKDMQLNSGWVYGNKKPTQSKNGFTHQGSFLKGIGFK